jgi:hypothetical protein
MSRLEDLIARQMVRLDTGPKRLLDAVKGNRPAAPSYGEWCGCGKMAG